MRWDISEALNCDVLDTDDILDYLLKKRGLKSVDERDRFLKPRLKNLNDPLRLPDIKRAFRRLDEALIRKESILIYADYDVDGMSSAALMYRFIRHLGGHANVFVPDRIHEGYGLSKIGLEHALGKEKPHLLIALDCGTTNIQEIADLREQGIETIILDHHEIPEKYPDAVAFVNPQRGDHDRILATVGITFKFCHAFLKIKNNPKLFDLKSHLDLVALGTIADMVPLEDDNRIIVYRGLQMMRETKNVGIHELMKVAGVRKKPTPTTVGFMLGPRLNASGRISEAIYGWELLTTEKHSRAIEIAKTLDQLNKQRQKLEHNAVEEAEAMLDEHFDPKTDHCIVVASRNWHQGVVGIVASRLLRSYYRPTIIISIDEKGHGKGSGRSIEGCSLMDALRNSREHLGKFGGHRMAAGLEIEEDKIPDFRKVINQWFAKNSCEEDYEEKVSIDLLISADHLTEDLAVHLSKMEPFGQRNPQPIVAVDNLSMSGEPRVFGKRHLKFQAETSNCLVECVAFGMANQKIPKKKFSIAGYWELDDYTGFPCFRVIHWK